MLPIHSSQPTVNRSLPDRSPFPTTRIHELDWVKGALVVFMVIYHAICYSVHRPLAFHYMAFLPPSFILITGFVVGQIYATKYDLTSLSPYVRLAVRGLKLLALFSAVNILNWILSEHSVSEGFWEFGFRAEAIFLSGNGRVAIFEVLLPIAYFLLLAPVLLWTRQYSHWIVPGSATAFFVACLFLNSDNAGLLSVGVIGMALGLIPMKTVNWLARNLLLVVVGYGLYRALSYRVGEPYPVQTLAAILSVLLLYAIALRLDCSSFVGRQIVLLGNYSLLAYLVQIPILRALVKLTGGYVGSWTRLWLIICLGAVLTWALVVAAEVIRRRSNMANKTYKAVFA